MQMGNQRALWWGEGQGRLTEILRLGVEEGCSAKGRIIGKSAEWDTLGVSGTQPGQGLGRVTGLRTSTLDSIHYYPLVNCSVSGRGVGAVSLRNLCSPGAVEGQLILNKASHLIFWTFPQSLESRACWPGRQVSDLPASVSPVASMLLEASGLC